MNALLFMLPFMLALGIAFVGGLAWAVRGLQYEDPEGDALRVLGDDEAPQVAGASRR